MRRILIIRFGSLGDLCLLAWPLAGLSAGPAVANRPHVTLATKAAFAPLLATVPGVDAVEPLAGSRLSDLWDLGRRLRRGRFDAVIDAHDVLRSHLLCGMLGRRPTRRIAKDTAARLALLRARRAGGAAAPSTARALRRTMLGRFDDVMRGVDGTGAGPEASPSGAGPGAALLASESAAPLGARGGGAGLPPPRLGLAPGARWDAKRWPVAHWAELLSGLRAVSAVPVAIFLGARERSWFPGSPLAAAAREAGSVTVHEDLALPELAARLADCRAVVTNDSGLLHLAEAVGTPVLALYGPTVREFGYYPLLPGSRALEADLPCRPCSRNGKRACWRGDLACLDGIAPATALAALLALPAWNEGPRPEAGHD